MSSIAEAFKRRKNLNRARYNGSCYRYHYLASPSSSNQSYNRSSPYMNFLTKINSKDEDSKIRLIRIIREVDFASQFELKRNLSFRSERFGDEFTIDGIVVVV